jgi:hypothetical protein
MVYGSNSFVHHSNFLYKSVISEKRKEEENSKKKETNTERTIEKREETVKQIHARRTYTQAIKREI